MALTRSSVCCFVCLSPKTRPATLVTAQKHSHGRVWISTTPVLLAPSAGQQGQSTLLAGTTSALSATRRAPDPNRPTRRALLLITGTNPYS